MTLSNRHLWRRALAWAGLGIGVAALLAQFVVTVQDAAETGRSIPGAILFYFSFFTILANMFCAACHAATVMPSAAGVWRWLRRARVRAAAALYGLVVAAIYLVVLSRLWDPQGIMLLLNIVLHYVTPLIALAYWAIFVPKGRIAWTDPLLWLAFPLAYLAYALGRGALTGAYPYPIIDAAALGSATAMRNSAAFAALFLFAGFLLTGIDKVLAHIDEHA